VVYNSAFVVIMCLTTDRPKRIPEDPRPSPNDLQTMRILPPLLLLLFLASWAQAQRPDTGPTEQVAIAIEHVTVLPMTLGGRVLYDATVVIENGRITALQGPIPGEATRIDGTGKWLIPGLTDMHIHMPSDGYMGPKKYPTQGPSLHLDVQQLVTPYIANGVTQIFNLDATVGSISQRNEIERGTVLGPHMALAALIDGGTGSGRRANSPSDGRQCVRDAKAEGYEFIKVYSELDTATYAALIDEAATQGLKTVGHIPDAFQGDLQAAFVPHFGMVAHAEEFSKHSKDFTDADAAQYALLAKRNGTWLTPTLTTIRWIASEIRTLDELRALPSLKYMHPLIQSKWLVANNYNTNFTAEDADHFDRMVEFQTRLVRAFHKAGVPIVAGTDAGTSGVVPGFSLHDELQLLAGAGLTNEEVLASATRLPAEWLGVAGERGTIEVGKAADLVLLDGDPLVDIANTRRISGVFLSGRWLDRAALDAMLNDLAAWNDANKERFRWPVGGKR
jgi:imidazolonepropionase-like amidohydrolase